MSEFVILIDKQEKHNYIFHKDIKTEIVSLKTADYSLKGYEDKIAIERKSLDDFTKTVTTNHDRFIREIKRMQKLDFACIVIEAQLCEILKHLYDSPVSPETIIGNLVSLSVDYKIPVYLCSDRQHALYLTEKILRMYWEHNQILPKTKSGSRLKRSRKKKVIIEDLL